MDIEVSAVVKHNGKWHEPGKEIKKVKKEDGERLIKLGVAVELQESEADKKARVEEAERVAAQKAEEEAAAKAAADKAKAEAEEKEKAEADKKASKKDETGK